jgi:phosphorylcholine metabolism protein LicD
MDNNKDNYELKNCLSHKEKMEYLYKINKKYNYPDEYLNFYKNPEYKICDGSKLKKIKMFDDITIKSLVDLMEKTVNFLEDNQITYWLDSGTLLGACRDGKFIPWDDDIDLAIPYDSYIKMKQLIKSLPKEYDNEIKYRVSEKYKIKFTELQSTYPLDKTKPFLVKTFHLNGKFDKDVFIDLMNYFPIDNNSYVSNLKKWKNVYTYTFDSIYPLKKITFEGKKYWSVNNPEHFLNNAYWFWEDLAVASHAHFKYMSNERDKKIYFTLK